MLQAILHGKLDRWLSKDAYTIEDLLTSVVLGSACYAPHDQALLPFLRKAIDERGSTLAAHLTDVATITAEFWPNWSAFGVEPDENDRDAATVDDAEEIDASSPDAPRPPDRERREAEPIHRWDDHESPEGVCNGERIVQGVSRS